MEESTAPMSNMTFTAGRAERAAERLRKQRDLLVKQSAPDSITLSIEAAIVALLEYEKRHQPIDTEALGLEVIQAIKDRR